MSNYKTIRAIKEKIVIKGNLVAQTPISVGGTGEGDHVDLDLALDGAGNYYIPGTSLAGPMRSWLSERLSGKDKAIANELFGWIDQKKSDSGKASSLFIEDSPVGNVQKERRHGISIVSETGIAKEHFLYTRALLPKGAKFPLMMELDIIDGTKSNTQITDSNHGALACIIEALQNNKISFGACKTRGFGVLKLDNLIVQRYRFVDFPTDLDAWLKDEDANIKGSLDILADFSKPSISNTDIEHFDIDWKPASNLMVKSGRDGIDTDMLPLMTAVENGLVPVIPGSSIKGVLRAHAQKILRTIFASATIDTVDVDEQYLAIVEDMFGSTESAGRLTVRDTYCMMKTDVKQKSVPVEQSSWVAEQQEALTSVGTKQEHISIDRFTGGNSDGALYSVRPVKKELLWEPITLALDLSDRGGFASLTTEMKLMQKALLYILIRDMKAGLVTLGFGSSRGLGEIEIHNNPVSLTKEINDSWKLFITNPITFTIKQKDTIK